MTPLRAAVLVARRELRERVRTRAFRMWTAVIVLVTAGIVVAASVLPGVLEKGPATLGVVPGTSRGLVDALRASSDQLGISVDVREVVSRAEGEAEVRSGDLDALFVDAGTLVFRHEASPSLAAVVNRAVQAESLPSRLAALGLTAEEAQPLIAPAPVGITVLEPPAPGSLASPDERSQRYLVATVGVVVLYIALAIYGGLVLNGVVEEKTNRVVEVLLGTLQPAELLAGKVFGIMGAAMLQLLAALAGAAVALVVVGDAEIPRVAFGTAATAVAWFVLGLVFYNFAFAAVGSTVSRPSDAQSASMPVTMLLLVPYLVALVVVPGDPNGILATVLSLLPLTSPMVMPARVAVGEPALWEVALALLLMLPAIAGMIWLAGRIYRGAILRGGPRVPLLQALRSSQRV